MKHKYFLTFAVLVIIIIAGCSDLEEEKALEEIKCADGTTTNSCSINKPLFCDNGTLVNKSEICGCPDDFMPQNDICIEIPKCDDGTKYNECSKDKPLYCDNGKLINNPKKCGCPKDMVLEDNTCKSKFMTDPKEIELKYVLRSKKDSIKFTVYQGLNDNLPTISRYNCNPYPCFLGKSFQSKFIDHEKQKELLLPLINKIKEKTSNKDDQARIVISLVQNIPYDYPKENLNYGDFDERYPYQVLYEMKGLCGEKSKLLVFLLRELGFGVSFLSFPDELHQVVGIKCPDKYSVHNTGYCFIEPTEPQITTNNQIDYKGIKLTKKPEVLVISEGLSFDSVSEEYEDAEEWNRIQDMIQYAGQQINQRDYYIWLNLVKKYCIKTTGGECSID